MYLSFTVPDTAVARYLTRPVGVPSGRAHLPLDQMAAAHVHLDLPLPLYLDLY
jgi:hypothetical protein